MSYNYDYKEVLRMMRDSMLDTQIARDIVRKAGLIPGGGAGGSASGNGPSLLATIDPDGPTLEEYVNGTIEGFDLLHTIWVRYLNVVYDTGIGGAAEGAATYPFSWVVPTTGLYRIDASVGVTRATFDEWQENFFVATWYDPPGIGPFGANVRGEVWLKHGYEGVSTFLSPSQPVIYAGTTQQVFEQGMMVAFYYFRSTEYPALANLGYVPPEPEHTRLSIQLIGAPLEGTPLEQ